MDWMDYAEDLNKQFNNARKEINELKNENSILREGLSKLQYEDLTVHLANQIQRRCRGCGADAYFRIEDPQMPHCKSDCWLSKLLEGK
jgi:hypothetical protein